ncbi:MAG: type I restriction endonuclease subunit R [Spirochaetota bacterium]
MTAEAHIEKGFIEKLVELKYAHRPDIRDRDSLDANFRRKFEELNRVSLLDSEFARLLDQIIDADVFESARRLREYGSFTRDDGTPLQYSLVNIKDWCKNSFEVVSQLRINTKNSNQRYDVIILINGLPLVQVELKGLGINPRVAMQQIVDYKKQPGNGYHSTLLCFMQLFIVSNRSDTWYFANNDERHLSFDADEKFLPLYQYADEKNKKIVQLEAFAEAFLPKCGLGTMISRYMVLVASERKLLMMRPYQIYAVRAIVDCIRENRGNGYVWHTTGSGKTLTSFKASILLKDNEEIHKCLFIVDRKDLDRQTREEFNRFQEGCVEENTNTEALVRRLLSTDYADKVIVTTIQKLGLALDGSSKMRYKERLEGLRNKRMVFIFDECHRSQFGENHRAIKEFFPDSQLFGFTGTPIFDENASYKQAEHEEGTFRTTLGIFEKQLHAYTITNAIEDGNVLRFHVEYYGASGEGAPKASDLVAQRKIVGSILDKHDASTAGRRFNALFASSSIDQAIEYHRLFAEVQAERKASDPEFRPLTIACVFSPPANGNADIRQIQEDLPQERLDNEIEPDRKREALAAIIADYNRTYRTNHSVGAFDLYYQDIQKRIKDQQYSNQDLARGNKIDVTIVVDMLLTGFDSKYLNTLYVDKSLKYHGLIQAFSRTNRVLNATKPAGKILDFRGQRKEVDDAIRLFSGEASERAREVWLVDPAPIVIGRLEEAVAALDRFMESQGLSSAPEEVPNLKGDAARGRFISLFKEVQRLSTQLDQYTDLAPEEEAKIEAVLPTDKLWGFRGVYLETAQRLRAQRPSSETGEEATKDIDFEYVLFAQALIDYDYIMELIADYTQAPPERRRVTREELIGLVMADSKFLGERDDIAEYIRSLKSGEAMDLKAVHAGYETFRADKSARELSDIAEKNGLSAAALSSFVEAVLERLIFDGDALSELLTPLELGWKARTQKELELMGELAPYLRKVAGGRDISGLAAYE